MVLPVSVFTKICMAAVLWCWRGDEGSCVCEVRRAWLRRAVGESVEEKARRQRRRCYMVLGAEPRRRMTRSVHQSPARQQPREPSFRFQPCSVTLAFEIRSLPFAARLLSHLQTLRRSRMRLSLFVVNARRHHFTAALSSPQFLIVYEHCSCDVLSGLAGTHLGRLLLPALQPRSALASFNA
jgi:hypothetical protein